QVEKFVGVVAEAAGDPDIRQRISAAAPTAKNLNKGSRVTGWPSLQKALLSGDQVVPVLREWLDVDEVSGAGGGGGRGGPSAATRLIRLVQDCGSELFHDDAPVPFISFEVGEDEHAHRETWPLGNLGFRRWLARLFYCTQGKGAGAQAIADAVAALEGIAL